MVHFCSKAALTLAQEIPKLGKVLHATASSVWEHEVRLADGTHLPFDYLVLASGSTWTDPVCSGTEATLTERRVAQQVLSVMRLAQKAPCPLCSIVDTMRLPGC